MSECGRAPFLPAPCAVAAMVPEAGTALWSAHRSVASGTREPSGARPGGQGRGLPHRSGQLPQEAPRLSPSPSLGAAQSLSGPPAPPLSTQVPVCAGGRTRDNSAHTGVHAGLFCFSGKKRKSPFPVFHLFVVFLFCFFLNFSFSSNFRPGSW